MLKFANVFTPQSPRTVRPTGASNPRSALLAQPFFPLNRGRRWHLSRIPGATSVPQFRLCLSPPSRYRPCLLYTSQEVCLGDIVICQEIAEEQAREYGHSLRREMSFLTIHSMLHLLGYDHMEPEEEAEMCRKQEMILQSLGIGRE